MIESICIGEKNYYKIQVIKFKQKNKYFYIGKLTVDILDEISTLRPVEKVNIEETYKNRNDISNLFGLIGSKKEKITDNNFNRPQDLKRAEEIKEYIETDENALIPNNIIIGCEEKKLTIDDEINDINLEKIELNPELSDIFNNINGIYIENDYLYIPQNEISSVIIDGQHRFLGLNKLNNNIRKEFEIPISFLIGYDQIVMAEIFYTINYTQKTVDKSLLTHLKNSFLEKVTESSILYEYISFINTNDNSPLQYKIKFPKDTKKIAKEEAERFQKMKKEMDKETFEEKIKKEKESKEKEIVSLSYFHSELENLIKEYSDKSSRIPILAKLFKDKDNGYLVLQILISYFSAIKTIIEEKFGYESWRLGNLVFTRSIGIGAFIQILPSMILKILANKNKLADYKNIKDIEENDFYLLLKPIDSIPLNEFEKAGGMGLLSKLKEEMMKKIDLTSYDKKFVENHDIQWILEFYIEQKTIKTLV